MRKRFLIFLVLLSVVWGGFVTRADDGGMLAFPYEWNDETSKTDFRAMTDDSDNWGWMAAYNGYWLMASKSKWVGKVLGTRAQVALPGSGRASYSFWYNVSDSSTFTLRGYRGDETVDLAVADVEGTGRNYVYLKMEFDADGPMTLGLEATLTGGQGNCYGSVTVKEICIGYGGADMAAVSVVSPSSASLAAGNPVEVTVSYENLSSVPVDSPEFYYEIAGRRVAETYDGTVEPYAALDYTFSESYLPEGDGVVDILAGVKVEGDTDSSNDSVLKEGIVLYSPYEFPYSTEFDDFGEYGHWQFVDNNGNGYCWEFGSMEENGQNNSFLGFAASYGKYDDYAISPAISVPEGKCRLSFYYAGLGGGSHLTVSMSGKPGVDPDGVVLFDEDIPGEGWKNAFSPLEFDAPQLVYLTFHITGGQDQLLVDKIKIDRLEDLCIKGVTADVSDGFNLGSANVTVILANHGMTEQKDVRVRYGVGGLEEYVEDVVSSIASGETVSHTFPLPLDISEAGKDYELYAEIATLVGDDSYNDRIKGQVISHFANKTVPYVNDFNEDRVWDMWTLGGSGQSAWTMASLVESYSGILGYDDEYRPVRTRTLNHRAGSSELSDDWAFSECLELSAGTYDLSWFYRTERGWNDDSRRQDLHVYVGSAPDADSMEIKVSDLCGFLVAGVEWEKALAKVEIPEDGLYYIGFHNTSAAGAGLMQIDRIELLDSDDCLELPYESDFVNRQGEWYRYNPSENFAQWEAGNEGMRLFREPNTDIAGGVHTEGRLVTPALRVEPNKTVSVKVGYRFDASYPFTTLVVDKASCNHPEAFSKVTELEQTLKISEAVFTVDSDDSGILRLGFRTNSPLTESDLYEGYGYECVLSYVHVDYEQGGDVRGLEDDVETVLRLEGDVMTASSGMRIGIYSLSGVLLREGVGEVSVTGLSGIYFVRVGDEESEKWLKRAF